MERLPNVAEWELIDLWRMRQENADSEQYHQAHRRHADAEILRRARKADAAILTLPGIGDIVVAYPSEYAYDARVVDSELWPLIERDGLAEEYRQNVSHTYKIRKPWLNRLAKRGPEYRAVLERLVIASTGNARIASGPPLAALGEYATREGVSIQ